MLQSCYLSVLEVDGREAFQREIVRFARALEFETVSATVVVDHLQGEPEFITVENSPLDYLEISGDRSRGKRDPVSQHCRASSVPIVWDQGTYVNAGSGDLWEQQARFGFCHGISLALHMPGGRHFWLGIDRDRPLPKHPGEIARMSAEVALFAVYAQDVAVRLLLSRPQQDKDLPSLTPRELECLRWTMEGKTAWEVGRILGVAEQTAVRHFYNAAKKLGCVHKLQAVLKALRLGLIH